MVETKNLARVEAGRRNHMNGTTVEKIVKESCEIYKKAGIAFIEKNPEPVQNLGPVKQQGGYYLMRYAEKAKPDFEGVLKGGRAILFDVKSTTQPVIKSAVVTERQALCLRQYEKLGAISAVLVCMNLETFYMVPWRVWESMKTLYGHMHMTKEELEPYHVIYEDMKQFIHFLNPFF